MPRPDYMKCIRDTTERDLTLCGRKPDADEEVFEDIAHMKQVVSDGGRLEVCPACAERAAGSFPQHRR